MSTQRGSTVIEQALDRPGRGSDSPPVDERTLQILERRRRFPATGHRGWLIRRMLLLADVVGLAGAALAAEVILGESKGGILSIWAEYGIFVASIPLWIVGIKLYGLYDNDEERTDHSTADEIVTFFHLVTVGTWILFVFGWSTNLFRTRPDKLATFWGLAIVLVGLGRSAARAFCRRRPEYLQNALIVGTGQEAQLVAHKVSQHPEYGINVVGHVADSDDLDAASGDHLLGTRHDVVDLVGRYGIDRVIIASSADESELLELARTVHGQDIQVDLVPQLYELVSPGVSIHTVEGLPLLGLPPFRLSNSSRLLKRGADIAVSAVALTLLAPLFVVVAAAIKLDSRGPVFFRQVRRGARDSLFRLYKFRTMVADADERKSEFAHLNKHIFEGGDPRMFKIEDDPRVTRVGRVLRRYLLDELPQLINVFVGDMSLVGPRPLILEEDRYVEDWARKRLDLRPGMTGLWQVLGRQAITFEEMVKLDYVYVTTWTFGGDLRLLLRTIPLVLKGEGGSY